MRGIPQGIECSGVGEEEVSGNKHSAGDIQNQERTFEGKMNVFRHCPVPPENNEE
jgi:hypothetical protein